MAIDPVRLEQCDFLTRSKERMVAMMETEIRHARGLSINDLYVERLERSVSLLCADLAAAPQAADPKAVRHLRLVD